MWLFFMFFHGSVFLSFLQPYVQCHDGKFSQSENKSSKYLSLQICFMAKNVKEFTLKSCVIKQEWYSTYPVFSLFCSKQEFSSSTIINLKQVAEVVRCIWSRQVFLVLLSSIATSQLGGIWFRWSFTDDFVHISCGGLKEVEDLFLYLLLAPFASPHWKVHTI